MRSTQIYRNDTHERDDSSPTPKISIGKRKERKVLEGLGINRMIILKKYLKERTLDSASSG